MPMNPRLLRPIASGVNKDAVDWRDRVVANSGSVSASTFQAVSKFCNDIDKAGIRDRMYRLNLFCGTGLNACLVPLYRGPSRTGTQYGNTTETNTGPFVSGDYAETGASGGLKANGSKWLLAGIAPFESGGPLTPKGHISAWVQTSAARSTVIGCRLDSAPTAVGLIDVNDSTNQVFGGYGSGYNFNPSTATTPAAPFHLLMQQASVTELYIDGSLGQSGASQTAGAFSRAITVFAMAYGTGVTHLGQTSARLAAYSVGLDMTAAQSLAYYNALNTFMVSLGRK